MTQQRIVKLGGGVDHVIHHVSTVKVDSNSANDGRINFKLGEAAHTTWLCGEVSVKSHILGSPKYSYSVGKLGQEIEFWC